jgi:predicted flap endonuclease-1-like 5' DNA nuclease
MTKISEIEGVGESYAVKLQGAGIETVESLLEKGASPAGRKAIAESTGISEALVLKWVNHADLFRLKGVGGEFAELLEAAGVDTLPELAQRRADNLQSKMAEINAAKNLVRRVPSESEVDGWITQAKSLERKVAH